MLEQLQNGFAKIVKTLKGEGKITENNVKDTMRQIRRTLLEADVHYKVVKEFIQSVQERAIGVTVSKSLTPGQVVVKIINDELVKLLGGERYQLRTASIPPTVILLFGLQGCGKTTLAAKLALYLSKRNYSPLLVPVDVYRPAATTQLEILGKQIGIPVFSSESDVIKRTQESIKFARQHHKDAIIIDTAGRLHINDEMINELIKIKKAVQLHNIFFVADGMTGQDAVNIATAFKEQIDFDGIILTKMDSDARGGAALSIVKVTGKPIAFLGVGEKPSDIEIFYPERIAGRILGMGDIVTLVEKVQATVDAEEAARLEARLKKKRFTLDDFLAQIKQIHRMGPIENLIDLIPGIAKYKVKNISINSTELKKAEAIIQSMTKEERDNPSIINGHRRRRIFLGSGTRPSDVNRLLNQYWQIVKMMKQMGKMKIPKTLEGLNMGL